MIEKSQQRILNKIEKTLRDINDHLLPCADPHNEFLVTTRENFMNISNYVKSSYGYVLNAQQVLNSSKIDHSSLAFSMNFVKQFSESISKEVGKIYSIDAEWYLNAKYGDGDLDSLINGEREKFTNTYKFRSLENEIKKLCEFAIHIKETPVDIGSELEKIGEMIERKALENNRKI